ncbi:MAG TPA: response regulator, partial [Gemmata sp.]|nr:response regulator [Gemmata sp.]
MTTLLVVDDEEAIQHAFQRAFRGGNIRIQSAGSAAEALDAVGRNRPDVIVLDIRLPDASGLDAFRKIQATNARIPIIL